MDKNLFLHILSLIEIFNENGEYNLQNKLINSLANKKLYINQNNSKLCEIFIVELYNISNNIQNTFKTSEIFINLAQMNCFISSEKICEIHKLLDIMISNFSLREFLSLLNQIKNEDYLNSDIFIMEIIFEKIYLNICFILNNCNNNIELITNELNEIFNIIININKYNNLIDVKNKNISDIKFKKLIYILLSLLLQLNNENLFSTNDKYFQKLIQFIKENQINDINLVVGLFRTFFIELYDFNKDINKEMIIERNYKKMTYINNEENMNLLLPKKIDNFLYNYFIDIINFVLEFEPNIDIVREILDYFEKLFNIYYSAMNDGNKGHNYIFCNITHIFNSKKIMGKFFKYLNLIISENRKEKLNIFSIIYFLFHRFENPLFFPTIKSIINEPNFDKKYNPFLNDVVDIISKEKESNNNIKNSNGSNKEFYCNSIEFLNIFYLGVKNNKNLLICDKFIEIFEKYFEFLKKNKMLLSKYMIKIHSNDNNNYGEKTILEICTYIFI